MKKLIDITGYWCNYNFNTSDNDIIWQGKILLNDDGWFEGIVSDPKIKNSEESLVFGIYQPGRGLELLKVPKENEENCFKFTGERDAKGYPGQFFMINRCKHEKISSSYIITRDVNLFKKKGFKEILERDIELEQKELESKIENFKNNNPTRMKLYNEAFSRRRRMSIRILKKYKKRLTSCTSRSKKPTI